MRRPFEYLLIGFGLTLIPALSLKNAVRLSRLIADTAFRFNRGGRAIADANLRVMFGPRMTPLRARRITRRAYRNMARVLVNIFWVSRDPTARLRRIICVRPEVLAQLRRSQPCVTVSAHIGNWEILSQACVVNGIPIMSVAKEIGCPRITARLTQIRSLTGQEIVPAEGALKHLLGALKKGSNIGLLIDQHTHSWQGGAWVRLFGLASCVSLAPAALARRCGVPIVFAWSRPLKDGRYLIEPGTLIETNDGASDVERTQLIATAFERVIRRHPSLWCINYRRWRYYPEGEDPARYPFYARPERRPQPKK